MFLPNPERAVVDAAKVRYYLLSLEHPIGRFKAAAFGATGYHRNNWSLLQADLLATARLEATPIGPSLFGQKYETLAILRGAAG